VFVMSLTALILKHSHVHFKSGTRNAKASMQNMQRQQNKLRTERQMFCLDRWICAIHKTLMPDTFRQQVDATRNRPFAMRWGITGFPTLLVIASQKTHTC
jgi:hypothetical protein